MIKIVLQKHLHTARGQKPLKVDLEFSRGAFIGLTGPSGSGKTTLLRLIAGLIAPEEGYIRVGGEVWLDSSKGINRPAQERNIGLVFQDYALFPNMNVQQNLEFALPKGGDSAVIRELIEITELQELVNRYPRQLSGGQQQRVALARALVRKPRLLLLDEPLSALDPRMRARLQNYILRVHEAYKLTTLIVSHDAREIFKLADQVYALDDGQMSPSPFPEPVHNANQSDGSFRLKGEVLSLEEDSDGVSARILVGNNILKLPVALSELHRMQAGDTVYIALEAGHAALVSSTDDHFLT